MRFPLSGESDYMNLDKKILSDITVYMKYAKFLPEHQRRETWSEIVERNKQMHIEKYQEHYSNNEQFKTNLDVAYEMVANKKILPSMRSMQFGGKAIEVANNRVYNCAFLPIDSFESFSESMFLLLGGTGVGYSVQKHNVKQLPEKKANEGEKSFYAIDDSIEGWADSIANMIRDKMNGISPSFDYSFIRPKGALLKTSGGRAPGPEPLRICLTRIEALLDEVKDGSKLTPLECHDLMCHLADAVMAGGIRRAAMISLFDHDDEEMLLCKSGEWYEFNGQRARANNSVVLDRQIISEELFLDIWKKVEDSKSGEPGFYFTNDTTWGTNPCCEIALRPYQFCNLSEICVSEITNEADLHARAASASFLGTLQAGYTNFHYLRPIWRETTEQEALIGVSMTGIASGAVLQYDLGKVAETVKNINQETAKTIGINSAARTTCVKPAGTTSLTLGTSSGIHAWHNHHYVRRIRVKKDEPIYSYLLENHGTLVEDDCWDNDGAVISVPQKAPEGAIVRTEDVKSLLRRIKMFSQEWIKNGHVDGINGHNVSATVSIKDNEWEMVGNWMWENRFNYNGISVLPYSDHTYKQAPFEDCEEDLYNEMYRELTNIDLSKIIEEQDMTDLQGEVACAGGVCEVDFVLPKVEN